VAVRWRRAVCSRRAVCWASIGTVASWAAEVEKVVEEEAERWIGVTFRAAGAAVDSSEHSHGVPVTPSVHASPDAPLALSSWC
jgi:ribosomal protein L2